ncbi:MAG: sigma-70 family RNA polymerase sigma factor [Lentisphaerales bacterium]|nr:sigma-70 family RNA polymerase sigma factor [Lentisphaerales bacterium]
MSDSWNTQRTLLQRVQDPDDTQAWGDFVRYYESFIKMVLRKSNVSLNEQDDLVQKILLRIWKGLPKYKYKREKARFRTWLSIIIRNAIITHINRLKDKGSKQKKYIKEVDIVLEACIEQIIDQEWLNYVASIAMDKVKTVFSGNAIEVFRLSLEEKTARQISEELNITEESVFVLRSRVKSRLKKEIAHLRELIEIK